jgi:sugar O-acyltransferase (sialic acid O-acetyltransferase NeuD family)
MQKLVIIGGSNAFWEIHELIKDINYTQNKYEIIGVLDDSPLLQGKKYNNLIVNGPIEKVKQFKDDVKFVFAIGSYKTRLVRSQILDRIAIPDYRFETLIHPSSKVFSTSSLKHGCIVHYGTVIFNHTLIDSFSIISANCVIASENYLGRGVLLGSNISTTKGVKIGSFSHIGSGTSIGENVEIEPGVQIGMGSLVLKDIKAGIFALGNPLRMIDKIEVQQNIIDEWNIIKEGNKLI